MLTYKAYRKLNNSLASNCGNTMGVIHIEQD